jgi:hypothetical protein
VLGKLAKYVTSSAHLSAALSNVQDLRDTGYGWLALIIETFNLSVGRRLALYHEFLAGSDDRYTDLTDGLVPRYWDDYLVLLDLDIVKKYASGFAQSYRRGHRMYIVTLLYGVMAGVLKASDKSAFRTAGKRVPFDTAFCRNPVVFFSVALTAA